MFFSVLMSIYNKEKPEYLDSCLNSLFLQTKLANEIILVEDGPINSQLSKVIEKYRKKLNIKSPKLKNNSGLASALNYGLTFCCHDIVIRMDTDDISIPERFQLQSDYLIKNEHIDVLGALVDEYNEDLSTYISTRHLPEFNDEIYLFSKSRSPISHPSCAFRKSVILKYDGYPLLQRAQDYGLWSKLITHDVKFHNLQKVLVKMRCGDGLLERRGFFYLKNEYSLLYYQYQIGFINLPRLLLNIISRSLLRLSPPKVKKFIYLKLR
jgi:glycosyltransferase involved in cell wall biosynthesis